MGFLDDWFGPVDDWFDAEPETVTTLASANGGGSKARILGTLSPKPQVPPWRYMEGPTGKMLTEVRTFLNELHTREQIWGNHLEVTFTATDVSVRVDTGLGGPPKGYKVVKANCHVNVYDGTPPSGTDPTPERGIIWLRSTFDPATLPAGTTSATVTLHIY